MTAVRQRGTGSAIDSTRWPAFCLAAVVSSLMLAGCSPEPTTPPVEVTEQPPPEPVVEASLPELEPVDPYDGNYQQALDSADFATKLSDSAVSLDDWNLAESRWNQAIQLLETIPEGHSTYDLAQTKIAEFNLALANTQQRQPSTGTFSLALQKGIEAATLTQTASNPQDWKTVAILWEEAIDLLKVVPEASSEYQAAQDKVAEYENNFEYAQVNAEAPPPPIASSAPPPSAVTVPTQNPAPSPAVEVRPTPTVSPAAASPPVSAPTQNATTVVRRPARAPRSGSCDCPYDRASNGSRCGGRSAYSRPGGRSPICYVSE